MKRRAQFNQFLSSNTAFTANRYFRLMAPATLEHTPISTYGLYLNIAQSPIAPWISGEHAL
jgi:pheromone a factor receptor